MFALSRLLPRATTYSIALPHAMREKSSFDPHVSRRAGVKSRKCHIDMPRFSQRALMSPSMHYWIYRHTQGKVSVFLPYLASTFPIFNGLHILNDVDRRQEPQTQENLTENKILRVKRSIKFVGAGGATSITFHYGSLDDELVSSVSDRRPNTMRSPEASVQLRHEVLQQDPRVPHTTGAPCRHVGDHQVQHRVCQNRRYER